MIELRCPFFPRTKLGEVPVPGTGVVEVPCRVCRRAAANAGLTVLVVHSFAVSDGACTETRELPLS